MIVNYKEKLLRKIYKVSTTTIDGSDKLQIQKENKWWTRTTKPFSSTHVQRFSS